MNPVKKDRKSVLINRKQWEGEFFMKFGLSSYSLFQAMKSGEMNILEVIQWCADQGAEHVEIVPELGFSFAQNPQLVEAIREQAEKSGVELSNYAIGANFIVDTDEKYRAEIERVKQQIDIANRLGIKLMRHDVASRPLDETGIVNFDRDLERLADACREIADYAAQYGITTSIENHGFYVQASDRVHLLVNRVGRYNFKTTLDIGNFMCVDEDPATSVMKNLPIASMVHFKDFYLRPAGKNPGKGWFKTLSGNYLRGAIVGQGDIDIREIVRLVKASDYEGYVSIEFEGMENCKDGAAIGLENLKRFWEEVQA